MQSLEFVQKKKNLGGTLEHIGMDNNFPIQTPCT